ncbi:MAG: LLM class flavin-dependent oxidoreductase [Dehalococcoidia bacterium]|jgi:alkanesulfonate monooxygenase SsuD/methylene tetrahydromethanopterin reductase-like flavin-dependent oxidoreductase (luciferase family)|nr:LLM class flavin-dependent oxidoreductase [Dehalococcoidia bacterium]MEE2928525.1 LLM class flavin-dependent oxidoreductase [Chloroflexota bacterium]|tara:strand:- start:30 stop:1223 length:1194 start_codon:yes stop_codon:yes gene_type:complete
MKFGILYETQRPYKGNDLDWNSLYKETLDQCELADQMGFDNLWFVEHHFLMGFSGSPCPEVLFGALSQRTKNIRIGFGVSILPSHHPIHIAERVAMVDQLTDGRVEFGTGRSNAYEQVGQGIDPRETRERWDEALTMLPKMWQSDEFSWEGKHWNVPARKILPGIYQKPHPRMYLACTQTESFRLAAQKGIGVLSSASYAVDILAEHVKVYRDAITDAEPVGAFVNNFWGNNVHAFCGKDDQAAKELAAESMKTFFGPDKPYIQGRINAYEELLEAWGGVPDDLNADFSRWLRQSDDAHKQQAAEAGLSLDSGPGAARAAIAQLDANVLSDRGVIIAGNPESCIKTVQMYEDIGVDQVMMIMQTETISHDKVMESMELFGKEVIPAFRKAETPVAGN